MTGTTTRGLAGELAGPRAYVCNTHAALTSERAWRVEAAGLHTVGLMLPVEQRPDALRGQGRQRVGRHWVEWRPDIGCVKVQTAVCEEGLCPLPDASAALNAILDELTVLGMDQIGLPYLSRLDVSADCRFVEGGEGLAVLAAVANARLPRTRVGTRGRPVESVMFYGPRGRTYRAIVYDKESNEVLRRQEGSFGSRLASTGAVASGLT